MAAASWPIRFSSKYRDAETGLYYYGYRFYYPTTGKWLTRDPLEEAGGLNLYGFVGNDPINAVDPWGLRQNVLVYHMLQVLALKIQSSTKVPWLR